METIESPVGGVGWDTAAFYPFFEIVLKNFSLIDSRL
jgi:hypothetical protein